MPGFGISRIRYPSDAESLVVTPILGKKDMKLHNFHVSLVTFGIVTTQHTAMPVCGRQISGVKLHAHHCPPRVRHLEPGWKIPVSSLTYETAAAAGEMNTLIEFCWGSARTASWVDIL